MDRRRSMHPGLLVWFFGGKSDNKKFEPCRCGLMVLDVPSQDETPLFTSYSQTPPKLLHTPMDNTYIHKVPRTSFPVRPCRSYLA